MSVRAPLIGVRVLAALVVVTVIPLIWRLMLWLPWHVDFALATAAAFAFAYTFEREETQ